MKELLSIVTRKGQVTVPAEIRRQLGLKVGEKVAFLVDGEDVRLVRGESAVARTAGAFKSDRPALSAEELRAEAEAAIGQEALERSKP
jgi:AbrB family looped-hinge helix DNA binding protein